MRYVSYLLIRWYHISCKKWYEAAIGSVLFMLCCCCAAAARLKINRRLRQQMRDRINRLKSLSIESAFKLITAALNINQFYMVQVFKAFLIFLLKK